MKKIVSCENNDVDCESWESGGIIELGKKVWIIGESCEKYEEN